MATHSNFCLENPMDRGAWQAKVLGVTEESDTTERSTLSLRAIQDLSDPRNAHHVAVSYEEATLSLTEIHEWKFPPLEFQASSELEEPPVNKYANDAELVSSR